MSTRRTSLPAPQDPVLVAIMNDKADFAILQDKKWYRIPVKSAPSPWPPKWLAFYQTKVFGEEAYSIRYYGRVGQIDRVSRRELFPAEFPNEKSNHLYYQLHLDEVQQLEHPIYSARWRRIIFIRSTWSKFTRAAEINDLYHDSPLEDRLWDVLKAHNIRAERQWDLKINTRSYRLDFAVFCVNGHIDVETDGDTYHANPECAATDNERNNDLTSRGWEVLRFDTRKVMESQASYCVEKIAHTINRLGGPSEDGIVPRKFLKTASGTAEQLTLFEENVDYDTDESPTD